MQWRVSWSHRPQVTVSSGPSTGAGTAFDVSYFLQNYCGARMGAGFGLTAKRQGDNDQVWFDDVRLEELYRPKPEQAK